MFTIILTKDILNPANKMVGDASQYFKAFFSWLEANRVSPIFAISDGDTRFQRGDNYCFGKKSKQVRRVADIRRVFSQHGIKNPSDQDFILRLFLAEEGGLVATVGGFLKKVYLNLVGEEQYAQGYERDKSKGRWVLEQYDPATTIAEFVYAAPLYRFYLSSSRCCFWHQSREQPCVACGARAAICLSDKTVEFRDVNFEIIGERLTRDIKLKIIEKLSSTGQARFDCGPSVG